MKGRLLRRAQESHSCMAWAPEWPKTRGDEEMAAERVQRCILGAAGLRGQGSS